jgi:tetratricopeptide (TPR) repeat protein
VTRRHVLLIGLCLLLAVAAGVGLWHWLSRPDLPEVDLTEVDPGVRQAVEQAMKEVRRQPKRGETWGRLGMVLLAHDFLDAAAVCLGKAEQLDPAEPRWPYFLVTTNPGDPSFVMDCLQRAAERADSTQVPRSRLAETLLEQGRLDEAEAAFRLVLQAEPGCARARMGLARLAFRRGSLAQSGNDLARLTQTKGCKKAARLLLAEVYQRQGEAGRAEQERSVAAGLPADPHWPDPFSDEVNKLIVGKHARLAQAMTLLDQGREEEALQLAHQIDQDTPDVFWLLEARLRYIRRDFEGTVKAYRKAIELDQASPVPRFELASVLMSRDHTKEAAVVLRQLLHHCPLHGPALRALGECERRLDDHKQALEHLSLAAAVMPGNAVAQRDLGAVLLAEGDLEGAVRHLGNAARLDPQDARAKELLEQARQKKGG